VGLGGVSSVGLWEWRCGGEPERERYRGGERDSESSGRLKGRAGRSVSRYGGDVSAGLLDAERFRGG
jgi:hypothetical protein